MRILAQWPGSGMQGLDQCNRKVLRVISSLCLRNADSLKRTRSGVSDTMQEGAGARLVLAGGNVVVGKLLLDVCHFIDAPQ